MKLLIFTALISVSVLAETKFPTGKYEGTPENHPYETCSLVRHPGLDFYTVRFDEIGNSGNQISEQVKLKKSGGSDQGALSRYSISVKIKGDTIHNKESHSGLLPFYSYSHKDSLKIVQGDSELKEFVYTDSRGRIQTCKDLIKKELTSQDW
jgi:hypothetical protein